MRYIKNGLNKQYIFAGLDFMIDENDKPVFLEMNSGPGLLRRFETIHGKCTPLEKLTDEFDYKDTEFIMVHGHMFYDNYNKNVYKFNKMMEITGGKCRLCVMYPEDIDNFDGTFTDVDGNEINEGIIFTSLIALKKKLYEMKLEQYYTINSHHISELTVDKMESHRIAEKVKGMKVPESHDFKTRKELGKLLDKLKWNEFVIKPKNGMAGNDVHVISDRAELDKIEVKEGEWILQEKINVQKIYDKFWDIRAYVVGGKFCGAVTRISESPVVNVSRGGRAIPVLDKYEKLIGPIAEKIVNELDKELLGK